VDEDEEQEDSEADSVDAEVKEVDEGGGALL